MNRRCQVHISSVQKTGYRGDREIYHRPYKTWAERNISASIWVHFSPEHVGAAVWFVLFGPFGRSAERKIGKSEILDRLSKPVIHA
jgi:hypothetical protein